MMPILYSCLMNDDERRQRNREAAKRYREKDPDKAREAAARYREKNRESIRDRQRAYMRDWSARNPERIQASSVRNYDKNGARLRAQRKAELDAMKSLPCTDCHVSYPPYVMQFDHRNPAEKLFPIDASAMRRSHEKLMTELAKCDLVCANCHAERTHQQRLAGHRFGGPRRTRPRAQVA